MMEDAMKIYYQVIFLLVFLFSTAYTQPYTQTSPWGIIQYTRQPRLKDGINIVVKIDSFSQHIGLKIEEMEAAAVQGVRAAGWEFKPTSEISIEVIIDSTGTFYGVGNTLQLNVNGTQKFVNVKEFNPTTIATLTKRMVNDLAVQIRRSLIGTPANEQLQDFWTPQPQVRPLMPGTEPR
jgi:hypothetical protein